MEAETKERQENNEKPYYYDNLLKAQRYETYLKSQSHARF